MRRLRRARWRARDAAIGCRLCWTTICCLQQDAQVANCAASRCRRGRLMLLALGLRPLEKFLEKLLLVGRSGGAAAALAQPLGCELVELGLLQPILRSREALPAGQILSEIDFLPF